jgi:hypothetical protein
VIKHADCKIREARQRIKALDLALADVSRATRHLNYGDGEAWKEGVRELQRLCAERKAAVMALEDLLLLDGLPAEAMWQA